MTKLSLRERRKQLLYEDIIDATLTLLSEKGHIAMSMDEIAARAGISKPTLYSYVATKDELIVTATTQVLQHVCDFIAQFPSSNTALQRLALLLQCLLHVQLDGETQQPRTMNPQLFQFLCEHDEARQLIQHIDDTIVALVNTALEQGEIAHHLTVPTVVRMFYTLTHAFNVGHKSCAGAPDYAQLTYDLACLFVYGVAATHTVVVPTMYQPCP